VAEDGTTSQDKTMVVVIRVITKVTTVNSTTILRISFVELLNFKLPKYNF
jgi:hypothetical protein